MKATLFGTMVLTALAATGAGAEDDCDVPMRNWQPRASVIAMAEARGWTVRRLKIDDGCYEIHAVDETGRRFEAKIDPATLSIIKIGEGHRRHGSALPEKP